MGKPKAARAIAGDTYTGDKTHARCTYNLDCLPLPLIPSRPVL